MAASFDTVYSLLSKTPPDLTANVASIGTTLFGYLAAIALSWKGIEIMLEKGDFTGIMGDLIRTIFFIGLASWFMPVGGGDNGPLIAFVSGLTDALTAAFGQDIGASLNQINSALLLAILNIGTFIKNMFGGSLSLFDLPELIARLLSIIGILVVAAFAMVALVIAVVMMIAMIGIGAGLQAIAIAFAPVMVPFLVLRPTSFIFDGWLKFLISTSLYKVVVAVVLALSIGWVKNLTNLVNDDALKQAASADGAGVVLLTGLTVAVSIAAIAVALLYMAQHIPTIASGLLSGGGHFTINSLATKSAKGMGLAASGAGNALSGLGSKIGSQGQASGMRGAVGGAMVGGGRAVSATGSAMRSAPDKISAAMGPRFQPTPPPSS